jgi:hypothetical protein
MLSIGAVEMACVAVKESMRGSNIGGALLSYCMRKIIRDLGSNDLFVLTTRTQHWFLDRGFQEVSPESLPPKKRAMYDHRRKPRVYFVHVVSERSVDEHDLVYSSTKGKTGTGNGGVGSHHHSGHSGSGGGANVSSSSSQ